MSHVCRQCSAVGFVSYELVIVDSTIVSEYRCARCGFSWRAREFECAEPPARSDDRRQLRPGDM
jgi:ribosomal protein L37E